MKILWMDTETGGLDHEKHSLLTVALAVYENGNVVSSKEFYVKHKDYVVTTGALAVNNINIIEHDKKSQDKNIVVSDLIKFIKGNFGEEKPVVAGHNIQFDINFLSKLFKDCKEFLPKYVSHRTIDTCSILRFLYHAGKLSEDIAASEKAFNHFNIEVDGRHTALGDVLATIQLYEKLIEFVK